NRNDAYDPADIGLSAIPEFRRFNFNPRFFLTLSTKTKFDIGIITAFEKRIGGNMEYIENEAANPGSYFEKNDTRRLSSQFTLTHQLSEQEQLVFRNSLSTFSRTISIPDYTFDGDQISTFAE